MAGLTHYYIDPASGNDTTGDGTIGTPWKTLSKSLTTITRDGVNGDQINVRDSAADTLTVVSPLSTYAAAATRDAPLFIRGYTTAANDGGVGILDGGGTVSIFSDTVFDSLTLIDLEMRNSGSAVVVKLDDDSRIYRCYIHDTTGNGIELDFDGVVSGCRIGDIGGIGVQVFGGEVSKCYLFNSTKDFSAAIQKGFSDDTVMRISHNFVNIDGASSGILFDEGTIVRANDVFSNAGTGTGIGPRSTDEECVEITNNLVSGFSGAGGKGIDISADDSVQIYGFNHVYDCTTEYIEAGDIYCDLGDNETGSSPVYASAPTDFSKQDVGNIIAGAFPKSFTSGPTTHIDKGYAQKQQSAGGGGSGPTRKVGGVLAR